MTRKTGAFKPLPDQKSTRFSWSPHEKQRYSSFFFEPRAVGKTNPPKVVSSNHAGCMPQHQRLTHKPCPEQTEWLRHLSGTFNGFSHCFFVILIKNQQRSALLIIPASAS